MFKVIFLSSVYKLKFYSISDIQVAEKVLAPRSFFPILITKRHCGSGT